MSRIRDLCDMDLGGGRYGRKFLLQLNLIVLFLLFFYAIVHCALFRYTEMPWVQPALLIGCACGIIYSTWSLLYPSISTRVS